MKYLKKFKRRQTEIIEKGSEKLSYIPDLGDPSPPGENDRLRLEVLGKRR